jgi:hypothetical protein
MGLCWVLAYPGGTVGKVQIYEANTPREAGISFLLAADLHGKDSGLIFNKWEFNSQKAS